MSNTRPFHLEIRQEENESGEIVAEIDIEGTIGEDFFSDDEGNTAELLREQLREISAVDAGKIDVNIRSLGGDVGHGLAIHDLLAEADARVTTNVKGLTASAATIIAQAGDVRKMSDNAMYLVHRTWTMISGNANDMESAQGDLTKMDKNAAKVYAKRSGKDADFFLDLMNEDGGDGRWLSAEEAKEFGLIDEITEPLEMAAQVDETVFANLGLKTPENDNQVNADSEVKLYLEGGYDKIRATVEKDIKNEIETKEEALKFFGFESEESTTVTDEKEKEANHQGYSVAARERTLWLLNKKRES